MAILHPERLEGIQEPIPQCVHKIAGRAFEELGLDTLIVFGYRNAAQQSALWSQGRFPLDYVNGLRKNEHLPPISEQENKYTVTDLLGGQSSHNYYAAVDLVGVENGKAQWDNKALFLIVRDESEKLGLKWGGRWSRRDDGHIEIMDWKKEIT